MRKSTELEKKFVEVEQEADDNKMAAIKNLNHWVEQEESRLQERLEHD